MVKSSVAITFYALKYASRCRFHLEKSIEISCFWLACACRNDLQKPFSVFEWARFSYSKQLSHTQKWLPCLARKAFRDLISVSCSCLKLNAWDVTHSIFITKNQIEKSFNDVRLAQKWPIEKEIEHREIFLLHFYSHVRVDQIKEWK